MAQIKDKKKKTGKKKEAGARELSFPNTPPYLPCLR